MVNVLYTLPDTNRRVSIITASRGLADLRDEDSGLLSSLYLARRMLDGLDLYLIQNARMSCSKILQWGQNGHNS